MDKKLLWLAVVAFGLLLIGFSWLLFRESPVVAARNAELTALGFPKNVRLNDCEFETMKNLKIVYTVMGSNDYGISCNSYSAQFYLSDDITEYFVDIRVTNPNPSIGEPVYFDHTVYGTKPEGDVMLTWYPDCTWNFGSGIEQPDGGYTFSKTEHVSLTCKSESVKIMAVITITPLAQ